jgi:hypothetical protein
MRLSAAKSKGVLALIGINQVAWMANLSSSEILAQY